MFLETKRTIQIEVIDYKNKFYVRTAEVAAVLGIKQQFEFTSNIREMYGEKAILKGKETLLFREEEDNNRTTFISVTTLKKYLKNPGSRQHRMIQENKDALMKELKDLRHARK